MTTPRLSLQLSLVLVMTLTLLPPEVAAVAKAVTLSVEQSTHSTLLTTRVYCSLDPRYASMNTVNELRIYGSRPSSPKNDLHILASMDRWNPVPRFFGNLQAGASHLTGSFGFEQQMSVLSLTLTSPAHTSGYRFKCAADGTDRNGETMSLSEVAEENMPQADPGQTDSSENLDKVVNKVDAIAKSSHFIGERLVALETRFVAVQNALHTSSSVEHVNNAILQNLQQTMTVSDQNAQQRLNSLETAAAENIKVMTGTLTGLQDTIDKLQQTITDQASEIRNLQIRSIFDVSRSLNGKQYLVTKSVEKFNIVTAGATCADFGGYLAELDDQAEFDFVLEFVRNIGGSRQYAVGAADFDRARNFVFYRSQKAVMPSMWGKGEPNNLHGKESCCSLSPSRGGMNDMPCDLRVKHVCEIPV